MEVPLSASSLIPIPTIFHERLQSHWHAFCEVIGEDNPLCDADRQADALMVWALSDITAQRFIQQPDMARDLLDSGDLLRRYEHAIYHERLTSQLEGVSDENDLGIRLRYFRNREMARIAWRDLIRQADLVEITHDLSRLACACVDLALERLYDWHCKQWGEPFDHTGNIQRPVVIGMGKLGACELNYFSDIDLIFTYPEDGETRGGRRQLTNQEFFVRLGQRLINVLDARTANDCLFHVDMRLRPFGDASPLAISFDAMEEYYQAHGRDWERYAMIKAQVVAGDKQSGTDLMQRLRPFVYRKYVDFGAFESLRGMKEMISREVQRKGIENNIKLGAGGIREVEFIVQAFQLIRGGREPTLQVRPLLAAFEALRSCSMLPDFAITELTESYIFLRNTEHRLQEYLEQQTHLLPRDEEGRLRLAFSMGFDSWATFEGVLRGHMRRIHQHFERTFAAPQATHASSDELDLVGVWQGALAEDEALAALGGAGYSDTREVLRVLGEARNSRRLSTLGTRAHNRLSQLMPLLLGAAGTVPSSDVAIVRLLDLIEAIATRSAYLSLLVENPMALSQLVRLCAASPWITIQLRHYPHLLDELLDPRILYSPPQREVMYGDLAQRLGHIGCDDVEQQMEGLRHFKQATTLRVAAVDLMEVVPLMVVSDHLTDLAEVIIKASFDIAWHHLVKRHGWPSCGDESVCESGFAVIGYGKLGGIELGYGSDLDIVFLHSGDGSGLMTTGERSIDNAVFYARLAQRMIHLLNTRTSAGVLYEVDTRLRPSGASGLLVSQIDAFAHYLRNQAWTWEHQALVRARVISGDAGVASAFERVRREILCRQRDLARLRGEVREMREKMRNHLDKSDMKVFDLKQGAGGIADIEFMVQYGVLAWSHKFPGLTEYTDNIRLLEHLAQRGAVTVAESQLLCDAYRAYRRRVHRQTLLEQEAVVPMADFQDYGDSVRQIWEATMEVDE